MNLLIIAIAAWGLITTPNLIRKIMCLTVVESMIILSFLHVGYAEHRIAPILCEAGTATVDPVPQALMLTAIVIGVCFNALALAFILKVHAQYGTLNVLELHES